MTIDEIIDLYKNFYNMSRRDRTNAYNSLSVEERREFAEYLRNLPDNKTKGNPKKNMINLLKSFVIKQLMIFGIMNEEVTRIDRNSELKYSKVAEFNIGRFLLA